MPTARIIKQNGFTVMSNYHLQKDRSLSLKAKGLLSVMLSLPDETWNFSIRGLASLCGDQVASVRSGIVELEKAGYLLRERERRSDGTLAGTTYYIYELPRDLMGKTSDKENNGNDKYVNIPSFSPMCEKHTQAFDQPMCDFQTLDNRTLATNKELSELNNKGIDRKIDARACAYACEEIISSDALLKEDKDEVFEGAFPEELPEDSCLPGEDAAEAGGELKEGESQEKNTDVKELLLRTLRERKRGGKLLRQDVHDAVEEMLGKSYQAPEPSDRLWHYAETGRNDASTRYFWDLVCCALEEILWSGCQSDFLTVGTDRISRKRLVSMLENFWDNPAKLIKLIYLVVNRLVKAVEQGSVQSPSRYARAVIIDVLKAGEARMEAELALVERPWLKDNWASWV